MLGLDSWMLLLTAVGTAILVFIGLYKLLKKRDEPVLLVKSEPPKPEVAKPEILDAKHCLIGPFVEKPHRPIHPTKKEVWFEFTANNAEGTKDCTLLDVSVELLFKGGKCIVNAEKHPFSTSLHNKTILAGQAKNVVVYGTCEPTLQSQENSVEGIITANFNNGQSKNTKGIFIIKDWFIDRKLFTP